LIRHTYIYREIDKRTRRLEEGRAKGWEREVNGMAENGDKSGDE